MMSGRDKGGNSEAKKSLSQTKFNQLMMLQDVRPIEVRELKNDEFKKFHLKGRVNRYRQYVQVEELRRLFK